jgi:hypothetical protein
MSNKKSLNDLAKEIWDICEEKGWNQDLILGNMVANLHTEISEAWEHIRAGNDPGDMWYDDNCKPDGFGIELADEIIRILHIAKMYNLNMDKLVKIKMDFNKTRPYRHGNKTC